MPPPVPADVRIHLLWAPDLPTIPLAETLDAIDRRDAAPATEVEPLTPAQVIEHAPSATRVRIAAGPHAGRLGWVPSAWLQGLAAAQRAR